MNQKKYYTLLFYKLGCLLFFGLFQGVFTAREQKNSYDEQNLLEALLLADAKLYHLQIKNISPSNYVINHGILKEWINSLNIKLEKIDTQKIIKRYQEATYPDQNEVIQYQQVHGQNFNGEWVQLSSNFSVHQSMILPDSFEENKRIQLANLVKISTKRSKNATQWVPLKTIFAFMREILSEKREKYLKDYIHQRNQGESHNKIKHLLMLAGINPSLYPLFYKTKKVTFLNGKLHGKIVNLEVESGFSLGEYVIMTISDQLKRHLKIPFYLHYPDYLRERNYKMKLVAFVTYDLDKGYQTYRIHQTTKENQYFLYTKSENGWKVTSITLSTFKKGFNKAKWLFYKRVRSTYLYTLQKKYQPKYSFLEVLTKLSLLGNFILLVTYLVFWAYERSYGVRFRKPAPPHIKGIRNERNTCFFNSTIQALGDYIKKKIEENPIDDHQDLTQSKTKIDGKDLGMDIQNKMSKRLRKWVLSVIDYSRSSSINKRTSTRDIIALMNVMTYLENIYAKNFHIKEKIKEAIEKEFDDNSPLLNILQSSDHASSEKELKPEEKKYVSLIRETKKETKQIVGQLKGIEILLDKKGIDEVIKKVQNIKNKTNRVIKKLKEKWKGKGKEKLEGSNLDYITIGTELTFGNQNDAQEAAVVLLDLLKIPPDILTQTTNRELYDVIGHFNIGLGNEKFTMSWNGKKEKDVTYLPFVEQQDKENSKLSEFVGRKLGLNSPHLEGDFFKVELSAIIKRIKQLNYKLGEKMEDEYKKIKPNMYLRFEEYLKLKEERIDEINKKFRDYIEKKSKLSIEIEPSEKERKKFEALERSGLFEILKNMGVNNVKEQIQKLDVKIEPPKYSGAGEIINIKKQTISCDDEKIKFDFKYYTTPDKLAPTGEYIIISPKLSQVSGKLPHQFFPDRELTFKASLEPNAPSIRYERDGLVNHIGNTTRSGHYKAYKKIKGVWYHFDDRTASLVGSDENLEKEIKSYSHTSFWDMLPRDRESTYIYLYKRIEEQ